MPKPKVSARASKKSSTAVSPKSKATPSTPHIASAKAVVSAPLSSNVLSIKPKPLAEKDASTRPDIPAWVQGAIAFSRENPAATLVGLVASALGLILLFGQG